MNLAGRRIFIAGSASKKADPKLLSYAHQLVSELTRTLVDRGALLLCGVGANPRISDDPKSPALIFYWDIIEVLVEALKRRSVLPKTPQGHLFATVLTDKTASQIPSDKAAIWECLINSEAVRIEYVPQGWSAGAIVRVHQTHLSDILIAIGGGEGVEHLAREFRAQGKPVIPLDLCVGASREDGGGGAQRLFGEARAHPESFLKLSNPHSIGAVFSRMETSGGTKSTTQVVAAILDVFEELLPPDAFYVRLLNAKTPEFESVERYFRQVIDPVVTESGYHRGNGPDRLVLTLDEPRDIQRNSLFRRHDR